MVLINVPVTEVIVVMAKHARILMNVLKEDTVVLSHFVKTLLDLICANARKVSLEMEHRAQTLMNALQKSMIVMKTQSVSILNLGINANADVDLWNTITEENAERLINVKLKTAVQRMLDVLLCQAHTVVFVKLALLKKIKSAKTLMNALQKSMIVIKTQSVSILYLDINVNADVGLWNTMTEENAEI